MSCTGFFPSRGLPFSYLFIHLCSQRLWRKSGRTQCAQSASTCPAALGCILVYLGLQTAYCGLLLMLAGFQVPLGQQCIGIVIVLLRAMVQQAWCLSTFPRVLENIWILGPYLGLLNRGEGRKKRHCTEICIFPKASQEELGTTSS